MKNIIKKIIAEVFVMLLTGYFAELAMAMLAIIIDLVKSSFIYRIYKR